LVEKASIASGVTIAILLIVIISISLYVYSRQRKKKKELTTDAPDGDGGRNGGGECGSSFKPPRPFSSVRSQRHPKYSTRNSLITEDVEAGSDGYDNGLHRDQPRPTFDPGTQLPGRAGVL